MSLIGVDLMRGLEFQQQTFGINNDDWLTGGRPEISHSTDGTYVFWQAI